MRRLVMHEKSDAVFSTGFLQVQARGGLASYMIFGTELSAGHHNEKFDFDESVMAVAVETLARVALNFPWQRGV